jgi:hypothetical protein
MKLNNVSVQTKREQVKWWGWILIILSVPVLAFVYLFFSTTWGHIIDTDYNNPPIFVTHNFVNLDNFDSISKYRSGVGHDYSGNGETCRSMRHYFGHSAASKEVGNGDDKLKAYQGEPTTDAVEIYAPADGWILGISGENTKVGKQMQFAGKGSKGWIIRLDHMYPAKGIHMLMPVKAGQVIGHIHDGQSIDMTVRYDYRGAPRLASYFKVMADEVFAEYQARGIKTRDQMIIPKEVVDANPWKCAGGDPNVPSFAEDYSKTAAGEVLNMVHFNGYMSTFTDTNKGKLDEKIMETIKDFDSCAKLYPVQETYPERCLTPDGRSFTKHY